MALHRGGLTDDQLIALGCVSISATNCEHTIEMLIHEICNLGYQQGKFFTHKMMMDGKLELLSNLWKPKLKGKELAYLTDLISKLKEANIDRNTIIHGHWQHWKGEPEATSERRKLNTESTFFPASKIKKTAEALDILDEKLWEFARSKGLLIYI